MKQFHQNNEIHILKLEYTLLNLGKICLHKSTNNKFLPFCENDKNMCEKIFRDDMNVGFFFVFTQKAVVDEKFNRSSSRIRTSIAGIGANPYSRCQDMPKSCTRDGRLTPKWNFLNIDKTDLATLRILSCLITKKQDQNAKLRFFSCLENKRISTVFLWTKN